MRRTKASTAFSASGASGEWCEPVPRLREARYSQSMERGLAVLGCFTAEYPVRGIADLAERFGMQCSMTRRYVLTLSVLGYLVQGARHKHQLEMAVSELGMATLGAMSICEHAHPYLFELNRRTFFSVALAVLDGRRLCMSTGCDAAEARRRRHKPKRLKAPMYSCINVAERARDV